MLPHPPYSPVLAPSAYLLFPIFNKCLAWKRFGFMGKLSFNQIPILMTTTNLFIRGCSKNLWNVERSVWCSKKTLRNKTFFFWKTCVSFRRSRTDLYYQCLNFLKVLLLNIRSNRKPLTLPVLSGAESGAFGLAPGTIEIKMKVVVTVNKQTILKLRATFLLVLNNIAIIY